MNKRIKELAEQCRIEEYNSFGDLIEFGFDEEKFAELIVRECMGQLGNSIQADPYTGEPLHNEVNDVLINEILNLKEHFGVE